MIKDLNNQCGCTAPFVLNQDSTDCICPGSSTEVSGDCTCPDGKYFDETA